MNNITLWGRSSAFNVQKILWLLGELDLTFQHHEVGGQHGGLATPEFLTLNPHGRVPVLQDGDAVLWESHAILRYLAACYGKPQFWSDDPVQRSISDRWMDWSHTTLQPAFMRLFWGYFRTPPEQQDSNALPTVISNCDQLYALLDSQLKTQDFLGGTVFSLADIPAGTTLYRYFEMGIEVPRYPHVDAWYERLAERSAYQQAVMTPFAELRGRTAF